MEPQQLSKPVLILAAGQTLPDPAWIQKLSHQVQPIVVLDGLTADTTELERMGAHIVRHSVPLGTGRCVKSALNEALRQWPDCPGALLVRGEKPFPVEWIKPMTDSLEVTPDALVLGLSPITEDTPKRQMRDRVGSAKLYSLISGVKLSDVGPVLRAVPAALLPRLIVAPGEGEEYFLNMILRAKGANVPLRQVELSPCYVERKLLSPMQWFSILWTAIRFLLSSLTSFGVDYGVFTLLYLMVSRNVTLCTVAARVISSFVNYLINRKMVFKSQSKGMGTLVRYYILAATLLLINVLLVNFLSKVLMIPALIAKPIVEVCVYLVSFRIQRDVVFKRRKSPASTTSL